jgi:hypothetical protein
VSDKCTHCYVGKLACGCIVAVTSDEPDCPKRVAKDVASFVREGMTIERMTLEAFRSSKAPFGCECKKKAAAAAELFAK